MYKMAACAVHNQVAFSQPFEDCYLGLVKLYDSEETNRMGGTVGHSPLRPCPAAPIYDDMLGSILMNLELHIW